MRWRWRPLPVPPRLCARTQGSEHLAVKFVDTDDTPEEKAETPRIVRYGRIGSTAQRPSLVRIAMRVRLCESGYCSRAGETRATATTNQHESPEARAHSMKLLGILFFIVLSLPLSAVACPTGMVFNGNGCSPPYEYTGWDWLQDQYDAIDSIGSDRSPVNYGAYLTPEKRADLERRASEERQAKEKKQEELAKGLWHADSTSTPEGKMCVALFSKYSRGKDGMEGGMVTIMGFQQPKQDAWLIFSGTGLPKPRDVKKLKLSLQQDDEPVQTVQVFNYKLSPQIGTVAFAVPGLKAALDGMRDKQSFKLALSGKTVMSIVWSGGAKAIAELKQCAESATAQGEAAVRQSSES